MTRRHTALSLSLASIKARPLQSALTCFAAACGIALLTALLLLSGAVAEGMSRNARGIDVVAGAKGSAVQLILSAVYQTDVPNGNIDMTEYERLARHPRVREAIPLALGDSYRGARIIGTTQGYLSLYDAEYAQGRVFSEAFEAVAGAKTGLKIGDEFAAVHGFSADGDDVHDFHPYKIVGVLKQNGTVLDRIITTPLTSVQELHAHPHEGDHDAAEEKKTAHQVTAVLLKTKGRIDAVNLPREINRSSNIMAASPSYQMARLSQALGVGRDLLAALAGGVVVLSLLMLLSSLASGLAARRYDLAVLRVLGASQTKLFTIIIAEGAILSGAGAVLGVIVGHVAALIAATSIPSLEGIVLPRALLLPQGHDIALIALGILTGMMAGLFPAISAARCDIAALLSKSQI